MVNKIVLSLTCALPVASNAVQAQTGDKPNLVIIMADQWQGDALGFLGKEPVKTPNLDKLAGEGVSFNQAVSNYPVSSPARAILMTGQYPKSNKVLGNCNSQTAPFGVELQKDAVCWSDVLKARGYDLGYIGKWHLDAPHEPHIAPNGTWNEWCPPEKRHGFGYWMAYGTYDIHLKPMYWATDSKRDEYFFVNQWGPEYEAERAIEFLRGEKQTRRADRPFALVVSMNPPHTPYNQVPQKYKDIYKDLDVERLCEKPSVPAADTKDGKYYRNNIRNYYACMTGVDEQVGRIIDELKKNGQFENTIVVFTSDHGNCLGIHNELSKNNFYEESMRVPLLISWPTRLKPRMDNRLLISISDLYPTLLTLMGFEKEIPSQVETKNLAKEVVSGKATAKYQPYFKYSHEGNTNSGFRGVRTDRYTYVLKFDEGKIIGKQLFDRRNDPFQMENIAGKNDKLEQKLNACLRQALTDAKDELADVSFGNI